MGAVADWRRRSTDTPHPSKVTYTQIVALRTLVDLLPDHANLKIPEAAFLLKWSSNNIVHALLNMKKREIITKEQLVFLNNVYKKQMNNDNGQDGDSISSGGNNMYIEVEGENNDNDGEGGDNISCGGNNMNIEVEGENNHNDNDGEDGDNISSGDMNIEVEGENNDNDGEDGDNMDDTVRFGRSSPHLSNDDSEGLGEAVSIMGGAMDKHSSVEKGTGTVRIIFTGFNAQAEHMSVSIELLSESHDPLVFSHSVILLLSFTIK